MKCPLTAPLLLVLFSYTPASQADSSCYEERFYPSVTRLFRTDSGFQAIVGGKFAAASQELTPTLYYDLKQGWRKGDTIDCQRFDCAPSQRACHVRIPKIQLSEEAVRNMRGRGHIYGVDQTATACVEHAGYIYFGISFYAGEGITGIGGIGRYHPESGDMEIRRPHPLMDSSITTMIHDGESLWLSTANHHECSGTPPAQRLLRYHWESGTIHDEATTLCGFLVHDILLLENELWLATDLGLSRKRKSDDNAFGNRWSPGWQNFSPDLNTEHGVKPVQCHELYVDLLETLPIAGLPASPSPYDQTVENLAKYSPHFLGRYLLKHLGREP